MKIWVTGGSGSLGRQLVTALNLKYKNIEIKSPTRAELNLENAFDVSNFVNKFLPTHVFHLAALVMGIGGHIRSPEASLITNTKIDNNVFGALQESPPKWIYYSSTVAAYGYPYIKLPLLEEDVFKSKPHESEYGYALSKRHGLAYLELLNKYHGVNYVYGLTTNLFGPGDRSLNGSGHVIVSLLEKANLARENKTPLVVWGEPDTTRDFLSTQSAASIIIELIDKHIGLVNVASGQEISLGLIASMISESFGLSKEVEFTHERQGISKRVCNIEKLRQFSKFITNVDSLKEIRAEISAKSQLI